LKNGAASFVTCDAAGTKDAEGTVERIAEEANAGSGSVDAYVQVANNDGNLRPGLNCRVRVSLPEIPETLAVPVAAVADRDGVAVVTLVRDGKSYETPVEIGVHTSDAIQITNGIASGDVVVTEGGYGLPDETPVTTVAE